MSAAAGVVTGISLVAAGGMALTSLGMVLTPGPNMVYLVSRSVSQGVAAGMTSLAGTCAGFLVYMTMANLGLAVVFVAVPWLYVGLKAAGVLYLACLAWQALKPGGRGVFDVQALSRDTAGKLFRMGLLTNLLNPKTAVMYLALIPQFIDPGRGGTIVQGFSLGAIQIAVSMIVNTLLILGAGSISAFLASRPAWTRWQRRITGSALGLVAILLAREVPERARI
ncbi:MAG: LysE family translocator [Specibacter sp.]